MVQRGLADEPVPYSWPGRGVDALAFYRTALALAPEISLRITIALTLRNMGRAKDALEESALYARMAPAIRSASMHVIRAPSQRAYGRSHRRVSENERTRGNLLPTEKISRPYDWHTRTILFIGDELPARGQMKSAKHFFTRHSLPLRIRIFWTTTASAGRSSCQSANGFKGSACGANWKERVAAAAPCRAHSGWSSPARNGSAAEAREE